MNSLDKGLTCKDNASLHTCHKGYACLCLQPSTCETNKTEVVPSTKGKEKVAFNEYTYQLDLHLDSRIMWRCEVSSCKGWLATPVDYATTKTLPEEHGEHCHPLNVASVEVARVRGNILQQAVNTNEPPRHIVMDNIITVSNEGAAVIGSGRNIKQAISHKCVVERDDHPPFPEVWQRSY